jgi:hypothetical protein
MSAFEADRFNHSRTSPKKQLSVASMQYPENTIKSYRSAANAAEL